MARPPFQPTDKQRNEVEALVAFGVIENDIAAYVGIDTKTLRKHFASELKTGAIKANAAVCKSLFKKATGGDTTAMIWWTKARMRWKETRSEELTGKDGWAIEVRTPTIFLPPVIDDAPQADDAAESNPDPTASR